MTKRTKKTTKKMPKRRGDWDILATLIFEYVEASRADEMKGGGDPDAIEIIEAQLTLARVKLEYHLSYMERKYE